MAFSVNFAHQERPVLRIAKYAFPVNRGPLRQHLALLTAFHARPAPLVFRYVLCSCRIFSSSMTLCFSRLPSNADVLMAKSTPIPKPNVLIAMPVPLAQMV
jgi:hypothetical protein